MNTHTFKSVCGRFEFTVKDSFLKEVPEPEKVEVYDLYTKHYIAEQLHNDSGPAVVHLQGGLKEYRLDGKSIGYNNPKYGEPKNKEAFEQILEREKNNG